MEEEENKQLLIQTEVDEEKPLILIVDDEPINIEVI